MTDTTKPETVVVGIDGSPSSIEALHWAERYCAKSGAHLQLITAWTWPVINGMPAHIQNKSLQDEATRVVEKAAAEVTLPADQFTAEIREGSPVDVLVDASKSASLVVLGSRGHGTLSQLLLGSVGSLCVHYASSPVVIVR